MTQDRLNQINTEIRQIELILNSTYGYGQTINRDAELDIYDQLQALKDERKALLEKIEKDK